MWRSTRNLHTKRWFHVTTIIDENKHHRFFIRFGLPLRVDLTYHNNSHWPFFANAASIILRLPWGQDLPDFTFSDVIRSRDYTNGLVAIYFTSYVIKYLSKIKYDLTWFNMHGSTQYSSAFAGSPTYVWSLVNFGVVFRRWIGSKFQRIVVRQDLPQCTISLQFFGAQ